MVPLYNHARYIGAAIDSVLAQGDIVREIVVIDDGSTDASADVMHQLARRDRRIAFRMQTNKGAHAAINAGLESCTGDLLAILNSDDAYLPGRLSTLVQALDHDPDAGIAASGLAFINDAGIATDNTWYLDAMAFRREAVDMGVALVNANFLMTTSNFLIRRTLIEEIGCFAALRYAHDLDFALRALAYGRRIALVEHALLRYRIHAGNTIAEDHRNVRAEWAIVAAAYLASLWDRPGAGPVDWEHAGAMMQVLRRHELDRAVPPCMAYLRRAGAVTLDRSPLLEDAAFMRRVAGWV